MYINWTCFHKKNVNVPHSRVNIICAGSPPGLPSSK